MKYKIEIKETLSKVIEVEAKDEGEALRKIEERYKNSEIILDSGDYVKTEIQVYRD
ncbi:MAG: DpnD/PcfM family protein [Clostridia bacterium]|nr:DpnD/PcfM family protein [Clostridia bacterium]